MVGFSVIGCLFFLKIEEIIVFFFFWIFVSFGKRLDNDFNVESVDGFDNVDVLVFKFDVDNCGIWFWVFEFGVKFCFWVFGICV